MKSTYKLIYNVLYTPYRRYSIQWLNKKIRHISLTQLINWRQITRLEKRPEYCRKRSEKKIKWFLPRDKSNHLPIRGKVSLQCCITELRTRLICSGWNFVLSIGKDQIPLWSSKFSSWTRCSLSLNKFLGLRPVWPMNYIWPFIASHPIVTIFQTANKYT